MKLLASDYDGTLKFGDTVLEEDIDAIRRWREEGNLFAIVTGRSKQSITQQIEEFDIPVDYLVTNNGGMVFGPDGEVLLSSQLDMTTAIDLMFASHELEDIVSYVVNDGINRHKIEVDPQIEDHRYAHLHPDWTEEQIMDSANFSQIVFSMAEPDAALALADKINQYFGSTVTAYANNFVVDVVPKGISKGSGLEFIAAYADVPDMDVYAIGDAHNDIPMLENCYNSAAVGMAPAEVKSNARFEYPTISAFIEDIE